MVNIPASAGFDFWWNVRGEEVEPANVRRNGESGVQRIATDIGTLYVKRQRNHLFRSFRYPLGLPTVMREKFAMDAFSGLGIQVPGMVFAEARKVDGDWQAVLVTHELAGFCDLESWYCAGGRERLGEEQHNLFLGKLGRMLGVMHQHRWQHTCLYPKHIFVTAGNASTLPEIALLDLEKARRLFSVARATRRDLDQLRRHAAMWDDADWHVLMAAHQ